MYLCVSLILGPVLSAISYLSRCTFPIGVWIIGDTIVSTYKIYIIFCKLKDTTFLKLKLIELKLNLRKKIEDTFFVILRKGASFELTYNFILTYLIYFITIFV